MGGAHAVGHPDELAAFAEALRVRDDFVIAYQRKALATIPTTKNPDVSLNEAKAAHLAEMQADRPAEYAAYLRALEVLDLSNR